MSNFPQQRNFRGKFNQIYISPLTQNRGQCKWLIWKSLNKNLPSFFITVINITIFNPNSASIYIKSFYYVGVSNRRGICPKKFHEQDSHFSKLDPREILKMQLVWQKIRMEDIWLTLLNELSFFLLLKYKLIPVILWKANSLQLLNSY